ncbi:glycosyltransferase [Streptomyces sp. ACA25]|uniref:glycosyltransferase n=1 Tax=Streptomyces sp. ACA25 TaxID=3022596 RepID=UPI002307FD54|nr:glycosyltransferase [Streptomyces sp. ACA25]MDB1086301.1 glycosyltransferase [Streptomyces sp. ACA25]
MRVLHVITGLGVGGAERQLRALLRRLPVTCEVLTLTNPGPVADDLRADGIPVTHLGMGGNRDVAALPRLTRVIREGRYDVVHTHLYRACVYGRIAARTAGVRAVLATEHSLGEHTIEGRPLSRGTRALYRATERFGSATVAVSATVAERLRAWGVPAERIHLIPNGIEAERFRFDAVARQATRARLGLPDDAFVVGGMGRLVPDKRFDVLLRAVARQPGARLLLVGGGPQRADLHLLAERLGMSGRLADVGECSEPEVPGLLAAMDVFVSASAEEAFGLAVLEALAAGLPVLHVACPAVDELPAHEVPGARRVGSGVRELADALRAEQASGVRRLPVPPAVHRYDISGAADRIAGLYARITGAVPTGARSDSKR